MFKIFDRNHKQIDILENPYNAIITDELNGIGELKFTVPITYKKLQLEGYVQVKDGHEYVIKEITTEGRERNVHCVLNIEELLGMVHTTFTSKENNLNATMKIILNGTTWTYVNNSTRTYTRNLYGTVVSSYHMLQLMSTVFDVEFYFDTHKKIVYIVDRVGEDNGTYFINDLNLKQLSQDTHTHNLITRVIPLGKDNLNISEVNGGKMWLENHTYSNKIIYGVWQATDYDNATKLKEDAQRYLNEMAIPYESYEIQVTDISKLANNPDFKYELGDVITIIDNLTETRIKQRIYRKVYNLQDPDADIINIASKDKSFEDYYKRMQTVADMTDKVINTDGTINSEAIDKVPADKIVGDILATGIKADSITADHIKAGQIQAKHITADAVSANHIKANSIQTKHLQANSVTSEHIQADTITSSHIQTGAITAGSGIIADGAIGNAQISNLDASKLTAGTIDTSDITIAGANQNLRITGNRLQVFEGVGSSQKERVSLGDVNADGSVYGIRVRGRDGTTVLFDDNGVTKEGITDGSITNDKINPNANIDASKININSVINRINKDGSTNIQGNRISIDNKSLSSVISEINTKNTAQDSTIASQASSITANTNAIKLKVDTQTYTTDKTNMTSKLDKATSEISTMKNQIALKVEQSHINNAVNSLNNTIDTKINSAKSEIKVTTDSISNRVSSTETNVTNVTNNLNNLQIGGRNLLRNSEMPALSAYSGAIVDRLGEVTVTEWKFNGVQYSISGGTHLIVATRGIGRAGDDGLPYCLSVYIRNDGDASFILASNGGSEQEIPVGFNGRVILQYVGSKSYIQYNFKRKSLGDTLKFTVARCHIEQGNKPTDWTPAPEDVQSQIDTNKTNISTTSSKVAEITTNLDSITQRVSSTESTVTTHTTQLGTVDSRINNATTNAISNAVGVKDTRNDNQPPSWYFANYPKRTVEEFKYADKIGIGSSSVYGVLTTVVPWAESSGGYPTQTFRSNSTSTYERKGTSNSAWGAWTQIENTSGSQAKATQALNDAKAYTTTQITTTNNKVASIETNLNGIASRVSNVETKTTTINNTVTNHESRIKTAENKITDSAIINTVSSTIDSKVNTGINNIKLGGRNYIHYGKGDVKKGLFTNFSKVGNGYGEHTLTSQKTYTSVNIASGFLLGCRDYEVGKQVTFSYEIMYTNWNFPSGTDRAEFWIGQRYTGGTSTSSDGAWRSVTSHTLPEVGKNGCVLNKWFKVEKVITIPSQAHSSIGTMSSIQFYNSNADVSASITFRLRNVKIEYGNKATDWSPAPEDVESKVTGLTTRVETAESKLTKNGLTTTIGNYYTTPSDVNNTITSKGYQTSSQVDQKVNQLQIKFSETGGDNLLYNSDFRRGLEGWALNQGHTITVHHTGLSSKTGGGIQISGKLNTLNSINQYNLKPFCETKPITLSYYTYVSSSGQDGTTNPYRRIEVVCQYHDRENTYHGSPNVTQFDRWEKITMTIRPQGKLHQLSVGAYNRDTSRQVYYSQIKLEQGDIATEWTPNPNEVYDGITTIDRDGITVKNTSANTYTQIDTGSFSVNNNNGATIAEFSQNSTIPILTAGNITANIVKANNLATSSGNKSWTGRTYYVQGSTGVDAEGRGGSWGNAFKSVQYVLDNYIEDILNDNVSIHIGASVQGWNCYGRSGRGTLQFYLENDAVVSTEVVIQGCTNFVRVVGTNDRKGTLKKGIVAHNCSFVDIGWVTFRGENWWHGSGSCNVLFSDFTRGIVRMCDLNGVTYGTIADLGSHMWLFNNRGSNIHHYVGVGAYTRISLARYGSDTCPDYSGYMSGNANHANLYTIEDGATFTKTPSVGWSPSYTPTQRTSTWNFNKIWSDETLHGWSDRNELIQGYSSAYDTGRWTGYLQMTDGMSAIKNTISGGTNLSGRIYVQRRTSSGAGTGTCCMYASDGTHIGNISMARGAGAWFTLNSSVVTKIMNGSITYFYLKNDSNNINTYMKMETLGKIELTYTK